MNYASMPTDNTPELATYTALEAIHRTEAVASYYGAYIGLDLHKDTIAMAVADRGRRAPRHWGEITHNPKPRAQADRVPDCCLRRAGVVIELRSPARVAKGSISSCMSLAMIAM